MRFIRHAAHRKKRLGQKWRKPRGLHNKMRDHKRGASPMVQDGYRTDKTKRGKRKGLLVTVIRTESDLSSLDPKVHGIVLGAVGMRKKLSLLDAIIKGGFTLLTGDAVASKKRLQESYAARRSEVEQKHEERKAKQEEREKKAEKEEPKKESDEDEEKSKEEREKEKVLTKAR